LVYYNPYLSRENDIFFNLSASYGTISNKSIIAANLHGADFDQKNITGAVEIGKRFGLFHRFSLTAGYSYVETPFYIKGVSASDTRIDHTPFISAGYSYDTRDLIQFPRNGLLGAASWEFKGLGNDGINYNIFKIDFREYRPIIGDLHAKWRFTTRVTGGKLVPFYDMSYIGFDERIRGHYTEQLEGNNYYLGSMELFYPILKDIHINLDFVPLLPKSLLSYRVAIYTELFGDAGTTKFKGESLSIKDIRSGYGGGLTLLILPYNVVRFEVGLDEYHNAEFILNVAVSF
jgi:outer membrane protein assembly factor BamA